MNKFIGHLKTVLTHKKNVAHYCFMCGLYWQGIMHDMSKFSPVEFWESVKYYQGTRSPIDACKEDKGYSMAWFHHRGRNKHHWEFWVDDFMKGMVPKKMPFKYALEMVCDYLGAGRAYAGKNFTIEKEYNWWLSKRADAVMHEDTKKLADFLLTEMLRRNDIDSVLKDKKLIKELRDNY